MRPSVNVTGTIFERVGEPEKNEKNKGTEGTGGGGGGGTRVDEAGGSMSNPFRTNVHPLLGDK